MEEVRSSILLSSTHNYAVLASAGTAFCDFGGLSIQSAGGEMPLAPKLEQAERVEDFALGLFVGAPT